MSVASAAAQSPSGELIERTLAIVGGQSITLMDVRAALALKLIEAPPGTDQTGEATQRLIDRALVIQEVDRYAVSEPSDAAVDERVAVVASRFASPDAFRVTLASVAFSQEHLRAWVRDDLRTEAYLDQRFAAADTSERRAELVRDWIADIRRRTTIVELKR